MLKTGLVLVLSLVGVLGSPAVSDGKSGTSVGQKFDVESLVAVHGYYMESHQVTTSDGYRLGVHRLPSPRGVVGSEGDKPVVLILHGLSSASHQFLALGPDLAVGYNLADAGFDVWLANARGNVHSRAHDSLDPDDDVQKIAFFDFSWEEIALYDLAETIDYVLNFTGKEKLHYIGHSQGGTAFLVLNSLRPEYNDKIVAAHLFAGVGYMEHFPNEELKEVSANVDLLYNIAVASGLVEIADSVNTTMARQIVESVPIYSLLRILAQYDLSLLSKNTNLDALIAALGGGGSGASIKQYAHYGQNINSGLFRRWNHGASNLQVYGSSDPPLYNLSLITVNTTMHYTVADHLLDERDVISMCSDMRSCQVRRVARESFGHSDFIAAVDAKELVTDYVVEAIRYADALLSEVIEEPNPEQSNSARTTVLNMFTFALSIILIMFLRY